MSRSGSHALGSEGPVPAEVPAPDVPADGVQVSADPDPAGPAAPDQVAASQRAAFSPSGAPTSGGVHDRRADALRPVPLDPEEERSGFRLDGGPANLDPVTGEPGSHPIGTAGGALAGGAGAGALVGSVLGPPGTVVGAVVGAVAGAAVGKSAAEAVNPTDEAAAARARRARERPHAPGEDATFSAKETLGAEHFDREVHPPRSPLS